MRLNNFINNKIEKIIIVFLFIQPILDLIAGFSSYFNIFNISAIIRVLFFMFSIYYIYFISDKKSYKIITSVLLIYMFLFGLNIFFIKDLNAMFYEIKNTISTFYLPIILLFFIDAFNKIKFDKRIINKIYFIYILLIFIPNILNIGFDSYAYSKTGKIGFFISANSIGAILSILFPLIISKKFNILSVIYYLIILYVFLSIGTKVPILSLLIILIFIFTYFMFYIFKSKKYNYLIYVLLFIITFILLLVFVVPKTSFYKNILIHLEFLNIKSFKDLLSFDVIDHFIFSQRLSFLNNSFSSYKNADLISKILGIGYIENYNTSLMSIKMIEMDYFDILIRHGIGFILFFIPIIIVFKNIKKLDNKFIYLSIFLIFVLALFSGHVLITPATSIYVALILAITLI